MEKKVYRSKDGNVLLAILGGIGTLAHAVAALIIPKTPESVEKRTKKEKSTIFENYSSKYNTGNHNKKK